MKQAKNKAEKTNTDELTKLRKRHQFIQQNAGRFQQIFNYSITHFYGNPFLGFDIVKFDQEVVQAPNGVSMKEHIEKRWGIEAMKLIQEIIK